MHTYLLLVNDVLGWVLWS